MKPLKMTITAFGPYKNEETIDFKDLKDHRLFVISGNTGAGKTSIFDAICFALYGDASGEDRSDSRMLRSQFAEDDVHTSVDFEFELRGRSFRVFRQMPHIKGTNKTPTGDKYELYETTNQSEILLVDRLTVGNVNQKIQEIIGLTKDQFRQIVMLPQGEFRKLLTSDTENKEEILRKIFRTVHFKQMAEGLNEKRLVSQKVYEKQRQERDLYIKNVEKTLPKREGSTLVQVLEQENYNTHQVLEALAEETCFYLEERNKQQQRLDQTKEQLKEKTEQYHLAKAVNDRFNALKKERQQKIKLDEQLPIIQEKEQKLSQAMKASQIEIHENYLLDVTTEKINLQKNQEAAKFEFEQAETALSQAQKAYLTEEENKQVREEANLTVNKLKEYLPDVSELDQKKQTVTLFKQEVLALHDRVEHINKTRTEKKDEKGSLVTKIKQLEENIKGIPETSQNLQIVQAQVKAGKAYLSLSAKQVKLSNQVFLKEVELGKVKETYEQLETLWIEGQASLLAKHLHEGAPCPVCGSEEHPNRAESTAEIPTKDLLDQKRFEKDQMDGAYRTLQAELSAVYSQTNEKKQELITLGVKVEQNEVDLEQLKQVEQELETKLLRLKSDQEKVDGLRMKQEKLEDIIEDLETEKTYTESSLHQKQSSYQTEQALLEQKMNTIPEHLQSIDALAGEIKKAQQVKQELEQRWQDVQQELTQAKERQLTADMTLKNVVQQLEVTLEKKAKALRTFKEALLEANFASEEDYVDCKLPKQSREAIQNEVELFKANRSSLTQQIENTEKELQGKEQKDLHVLVEQLKQLEQELEGIHQGLTQINQFYEAAMKGKNNIELAHEQVEEAEEMFYLHKDLYDVVRGENSKKMSFERYLQIEFLEQIVQAANERLNRLSNGQFQLIRSERLEKRGKQSGLGLDVFDNYTGHNRDVKTLSGGEKFHASLSLALGMADVIQSHQGGISIETMFIDEGFGSLDEESLNKAIDTLIDLQQSGRLIGIISHVQELKQAIPAILDVKKTREGHSQTTFILK
ncbi:AAA family ATPase [Halalkalibacter alkalisediminis]|uniref:Nuclease SbcCD subunit C n=1 Tax=Halalkalibacter alkalisediminis TaxID=935616 RepID=A0ABV6NJK3_9BACI|nr:SMC family ATPase [Halalkalibacter alkalisediminis]